VDDQSLARSRSIHRRTGPTFYLATRLLPERVREPTYALYGFFRIADEVVDGGGPAAPAAQRGTLDRLRAAALGETPAEDPAVGAFAEVRATHDIPAADVDRFVDAMQTDVDTERYETYADLESYMAGSAAAVGHMMTALMAPTSPERARPHAASLGEAFQLTNFVRDVAEDYHDLGRVYLPQETLRRYGVDEVALGEPTASEGVRNVVKHELRRAESLYRHGVAGIQHLPRDCQLPVLLASVLYAEHHRYVRSQDFDVLTSEPALTRRRKLWVLARTLYAWRRNPDPVAAFERVSAVPTGEAAAGSSPGPTGTAHADD
jgi:phytoene synthase